MRLPFVVARRRRRAGGYAYSAGCPEALVAAQCIATAAAVLPGLAHAVVGGEDLTLRIVLLSSMTVRCTLSPLDEAEHNATGLPATLGRDVGLARKLLLKPAVVAAAAANAVARTAAAAAGAHGGPPPTADRYEEERGTKNVERSGKEAVTKYAICRGGGGDVVGRGGCGLGARVVGCGQGRQ